jgi:hypothetical protein
MRCCVRMASPLTFARSGAREMWRIVVGKDMAPTKANLDAPADQQQGACLPSLARTGVLARRCT